MASASEALTTPALLRLLHLVSPALPVGAYAYSQALEFAVHSGWVFDEASTLSWLRGLSQHALGTLDLPLLARLHRAFEHGDAEAAQAWNAQLLASRETHELRAQERHLGRSLLQVLQQLEVVQVADWRDRDPTWAALFALAAVYGQIPERATLGGYLWSWSENQVIAAIKLVPLGQSAGQRLLHQLSLDMPMIIERAQQLPEEDIGIATTSQALASALHETQYSRLFRS